MNRRTTAAGAAIAAVLAITVSATALATADAAPSHARTSDKAGAFHVTAGVNNTEPLQGSKIKIKGSVKPASPGARVTLQLRYADQKKWKNIDTANLSAASKYKFKDKVTSVRERKYRVVKPAGSNRAAGHSPVVKVTVFGWRDLTSLSPATSTNVYEVNSLNINGVAFPHSLRSYIGYPPPGNTGSIDYNLNRDCKQFRGTVGLDDTSPASGTAQIALTTDGIQRYAGSFALTQSAPVAFDVTKVFRITFSLTTTNNGLAAVGTPQVLCSF